MKFRKLDRFPLDSLFLDKNSVAEIKKDPLILSIHHSSPNHHPFHCSYCHRIACEDSIYQALNILSSSAQLNSFFPHSSSICCDRAKCRDRYCSQECKDADYNLHRFICSSSDYPLASSFRSYMDKFGESLPLDLATRILFAMLRDLSVENLSQDLRKKIATFQRHYSSPCPVNGSSDESKEEDISIFQEELISESYELVLGLIIYEKADILFFTEGYASVNTNLSTLITEAFSLEMWKILVIIIYNFQIKLNVDSPILALARALPTIQPEKYRHQLYLDHIHPLVKSSIRGEDISIDRVRLERHISNLLSSYLPYSSKFQEQSIEMTAFHPSLAHLSYSCIPNISVDMQYATDHSTMPYLEAMILRDIDDSSFTIKRISLSSDTKLKKWWTITMCHCPRCKYDVWISKQTSGSKRSRDSLHMSISDIRIIAEDLMVQGEESNHEAAELWQYLIEHSEDNALKGDAYFALGACFLAVQQWREAHETWRMGSSLFPDHLPLKLQLMKLQGYNHIRLLHRYDHILAHEHLCCVLYSDLPSFKAKYQRINESALVAVSSEPWLTGKLVEIF